MKRGRTVLGLSALGVVGLNLLRRRRLDLAGKVALVTGGSRGLGLAIARELVRRKARVAIVARDETELAAARADLAARGGEVLALPCDVTDSAQVGRTVADIRLAMGPIEAVFSNAGIIRVGPIETMTRADFEDAIAVNFWGAVNVAQAVVPGMQQRGRGRIVHITSIGGKVAVPHLLAYDCAKFATVGFSEGLRAELAKDGIRVTTIVPGLMRTGSPLNADFKGDAAKELAWFAGGDATPLTAMSAARAARRIVVACERGEAEVTLSWQAKLLRLAHALAPGLVIDALGVVNRLLPRGDGHGAVRGRDLPAGRGLVRRLLERDARALHQM